MSEATETTIETAPAWLADMEFCHISPDDGEAAYCGHAMGEQWTCGWYDGEAVCPGCGQPTCPRCAQLEAINLSLQNS